jgi:hypothetical protein
MRTKKFIALLLTAIMVMANVGSSVIANAEDTTRTYLEVTDNSTRLWDLEPGKTTTVVIPVKGTSIYIYNPSITAKAVDSTAPITMSKPKLYTSAAPLGVFAIEVGGVTFIQFDVTTKENAAIGKYNIDVEVTFDALVIDSDGSSETKSQTVTLPIVGRVTKEKAPAQLSISNVKYNEDAAAIGNTFDLTFDVKNEGEISALNSYISIDYGTTGLVAGYAAENVKIGDLATGETKSVKLSMKVLATASEGLKDLKAGFSYKDPEGKSYTSSKTLHVTVKKTSTQASNDAKLVVNNTAVNNEIAAGSEFNIVGEIKNVGKLNATNIEVSILNGTGVSSGIISTSDVQILSVADISAGKSRDFKFPLLATETSTGGLTELTVQVSYTDSKGNTKTTVVPFYVTVIKKDTALIESDVTITNVSQSPAQPLVGQKVTVAFDVENRGKKTISDVKVGGESLSSAGFEPFTAQALKDVGSIAAGEKKTVYLDFKVGAGIPEGMNTLAIGCQFKDGSGNKQTMTTSVYILDVVNDSNSKPKVIVDSYTKDSEELKAGSTFNFTYYLKNTHATKAAKNIKVSVIQADNVFSAAQGTNTFYIDRINPGEITEGTIELKVKSDVATAAYELEIKMEYEYDDMSKVDQEAGGVTESSKIKLQAIENLRPSVQNLVVGYGEPVFTGASSVLCFDFINMGKSPLNNVRFSLEGDFALEMGTSYFHGTVAPGAPEYIELAMMPSVAGLCGGTIVMTFEDSNGAEVVKRHEFSDINVMEQMNFDEGNVGGMDPGVPTFEETDTKTKKDIMPVWLFIVLQIAIIAIFIPVVRIIIIKVHKKKLHKQEDKY